MLGMGRIDRFAASVRNLLELGPDFLRRSLWQNQIRRQEHGRSRKDNDKIDKSGHN